MRCVHQIGALPSDGRPAHVPLEGEVHIIEVTLMAGGEIQDGAAIAATVEDGGVVLTPPVGLPEDNAAKLVYDDGTPEPPAPEHNPNLPLDYGTTRTVPLAEGEAGEGLRAPTDQAAEEILVDEHSKEEGDSEPEDDEPYAEDV